MVNIVHDKTVTSYRHEIASVQYFICQCMKMEQGDGLISFWPTLSCMSCPSSYLLLPCMNGIQKWGDVILSNHPGHYSITVQPSWPLQYHFICLCHGNGIGRWFDFILAYPLLHVLHIFLSLVTMYEWYIEMGWPLQDHFICQGHENGIGR